MACFFPLVAAVAAVAVSATHRCEQLCVEDEDHRNEQSCCPEVLQDVALLQTSLSIKEDVVEFDDSLLAQIPLSAQGTKYTSVKNQSRPATSIDLAQRTTYTEKNETGAAQGRRPGNLLEVILQASRRGHATNGTDVDAVIGVTQNAEGDMVKLLSSACLYFGACVACVLWVSCCRRRVPMVYGHRSTDGIYMGRHAAHAKIPGECSPHLSDGLFTWIPESIAIGPTECTFYSGVDQGLLMEFLELCMRIVVRGGVPVCIVAMPCYWTAGNQGLGVLGKLEYMNAPDSWANWIAAGGVWYIVLVVQWSVFHAMEAFHPIRVNWLKAMSAPRATTVLVDEIPPERNSVQALTSFFDDEVFHRPVVKSVYITKDTSQIQPLIKKHEKVHFDYQAAEHAGKMEEASRLKAEEAEIDREMARMREVILSSNELNCETAFVEFYSRKDAHMAEKLFNPDHDEELIVTVPPDPVDVIWTDLQVDKARQHVRDVIGFALIVVLLIFIVNVVLWMSAVLEFEKMKKIFPLLGRLAEDNPSFPDTWNGISNEVGLNLVLSLLPTVLMWIFYSFWTMQAHAWSQVMLQHWYFYFLIISTLLAQAIGDRAIEILQNFLQHPYSAIDLLATKIPAYSHFFISYMCVQWFTHALNITRYFQLMKYCFLRLFYAPKIAHGLSEPEDQDYYGIGSRYARFTFQLVIWMCFSIMSPIMVLPALVNFAICDLCYGYLLVYAETRKPDLGGVFFVGAMKQLQHGLVLMILGMTGLLAMYSASKVPAYLAASSLIFVGYTYYKFCHEIRWELLDFNDFLDPKGFGTRPPTKNCYIQPELEDHSETKDEKEDNILAAASLRMQKSLSAAWQFASCNAPPEVRQAQDRIPSTQEAVTQAPP
eukprot:TRINITY_DN5529_c0_g1_i1.p1 TRINITY_DN5529_c0_g1~~TRINITY_DN5529_c0_g1_i1.p1  ORF type:complete len:892 (+),score=120.16 TRINITY_DN5529_c0_g1_i1:38-2677(+)